MISMVYFCSKCDAIMNPTTVEWSEIYEMSVQFYECPNCGAVEEEVIS